MRLISLKGQRMNRTLSHYELLGRRLVECNLARCCDSLHHDLIALNKARCIDSSLSFSLLAVESLEEFHLLLEGLTAKQAMQLRRRAPEWHEDAYVHVVRPR